jgi:hypothetical protein
MQDRDFFGPIPESAEIVYDSSIDTISTKNRESAWYGIFRAATYLHDGKKATKQDPDALLVVPYSVDDADSIIGIALSGAYVNKPRCIVVLLRYDFTEVSSNCLKGVLRLFDAPDLPELELSGEMSDHIMDMSDALYTAIDTLGGNVLDLDDRRG